MARHYTHTLSLSLGGDAPTFEGEATVSFTVNPGCAETPPRAAIAKAEPLTEGADQ